MAIKSIYDIKSTNSNVELKEFKNNQELLKTFNEFGSGYSVIWLFPGIKVFDLNQKIPELEEIDFEKNLVKARIFNSEREWYIWRSENKIKGRLREDGQGEYSQEFVDVESPLRSVVGNQINQIGIGDKKNKLLMRNYIDHQNNQAGYSDMRFVEFKND